MSEDRDDVPGGRRLPEPATAQVADRGCCPPRLRRRGSATSPPAPTGCATGSRSRCSSSRCSSRGASSSASASPAAAASCSSVVVVVTLLAIAAALAPHVGPFRLTAPQADVRRTTRIRFWLSAAYLALRARLHRVPRRADRPLRRNRCRAAGRRTGHVAGRRGRAARGAAADHQYHLGGQRLSPLVRVGPDHRHGVDRARGAGRWCSTCSGDCATSSSPTSTSAATTPRSSSPHFCTARWR